MSIVILQLPDVKRKSEIRPKACPNCHGETIQRWGRVTKPVKDNRHRTVVVYRYRCCHCKCTFRHYPTGVDRATQTQRMRKLAALFWVLGLSLRGVCSVLGAFGISLSHMSVWRDIQEQAKVHDKRHQWQNVRILGVDDAYPLGWGEKLPVLIAVDMGTGELVELGYVDEKDPRAVRRFLEPLVQQLGVSVVVTDDHAVLRSVIDKLDVEHQVCQLHLRRWVGRSLHKLRQQLPDKWLWVVEETTRLFEELPINGGSRLFDLWKQVAVPRRRLNQPLSPVDELRLLIIRLSENWHRYRVFDWQSEVPWTNNITEQVIGKMKIRSRTVRGYKSWQGMWAALLLTGIGPTF